MLSQQSIVRSQTAREEESMGNIQAIRRRLSDILMEAKALAVTPSSPLRIHLVPPVVASPGAPLTRQTQSKLNGSPLDANSQLLLRSNPDAPDETVMREEQRFPSQSVLRATTGGLSKSLLADLMSSREEEEDILAYVQRAYKVCFPIFHVSCRFNQSFTGNSIEDCNEGS